MKQFTAIVLAAGKGKRMKSSLPKVLHGLGGYSLIHHVLHQLEGVKKYVKQIVVVLGYEGNAIEKEVSKRFTNIDFVYQKDLSGTASAVKCALPRVKHKNVLVLCADAPLIQKSTLILFISKYLRNSVSAALISAQMKGDNQLGRIIRDCKGDIKAIKEKSEYSVACNDKEVNSGIYCFLGDKLFKSLERIARNNKKGEYFLTDVIEILYKAGDKIGSYLLADSNEILGINTQKDILFAEQILRERIVNAFIEKGVKIVDWRNTYIETGVKIGKNTVIYPFTFIEKDVIIGNNCVLGPFLRLRSGTKIKKNTQLGNFIEINRSALGQGVTMKHLGYLGDADIKDNVNIGAGTVVANYDGKKKNKTVIGKGAFIGCDTVLVAPVKVGGGAITGAGSVIIHDVEPNSVVIGVPAKVLKRKKKG
ncbi:MAG: NTP transferase domain-containing protein [Candidatus Omnitrophota bacterium]|nr:NTP transferase domain-containing protein [Candidatus Omnitrophota bacterium]